MHWDPNYDVCKWVKSRSSKRKRSRKTLQDEISAQISRTVRICVSREQQLYKRHG